MQSFNLPGYEHYARFPELYHARLIDLDDATRAKAMPILTELLIEQLQEHGPLQAAALRYYVNRENKLQLEMEDISELLWAGKRHFQRFFVKEQEVVHCWRTLEQAHQDLQPSLQIVKDFETRYYELLTYVRLAHNEPATLQAPLEQLRQLGLV